MPAWAFNNGPFSTIITDNHVIYSNILCSAFFAGPVRVYCLYIQISSRLFMYVYVYVYVCMYGHHI